MFAKPMTLQFLEWQLSHPSPPRVRSFMRVKFAQLGEDRAHWVSSALSLIGGVHIGARALLDIKLLWFGYIARLS